MIEEVIWTGAASQDYLTADPQLASVAAIDGGVELLRLFPDMGVSVGDAKRVRRVLIGRRRFYGLYYAVNGARLVVLALIDLRQEPAKIEAVLEERGIEA